MLDIIERILSYHKSFSKDTVFANLKTQLLSILEDTSDDNIKIILGSSYSRDEELCTNPSISITPEKDSKDDYNVLIDIDSDNYNYIFEIFEGGISLSGTYYDEEGLLHLEAYDYQKNTKLIITKEILDRNDYCYDYQINIINFNKKENAKPVRAVQEENEVFSAKFGVPLTESEYYRHHFKENRAFLNESKIKSEMEYEDNSSTNECAFSSPFTISDFALIFDLNEEHFYEAISNAYTIEDLIEAKRKIDSLKELLTNIIGVDGKIIIEDNLYLNISSYIYNSSVEFLTTRGRIIKKINGNLYMFILEIKNNKITYAFKPLTKEEAKNLYYANERNFTTKDLQEFFMLEPNLSL